MAKIDISKCEVFQDTTLEVDIDKVIYNFILGEIKNKKYTEDK